MRHDTSAIPTVAMEATPATAIVGPWAVSQGSLTSKEARAVPLPIPESRATARTRYVPRRVVLGIEYETLNSPPPRDVALRANLELSGLVSVKLTLRLDELTGTPLEVTSKAVTAVSPGK